jgi:hypothetical protein
MEGVDNRLFGRAAVVMLQRFVLMPMVAVGLVMGERVVVAVPIAWLAELDSCVYRPNPRL